MIICVLCGAPIVLSPGSSLILWRRLTLAQAQPAVGHGKGNSMGSIRPSDFPTEPLRSAPHRHHGDTEVPGDNLVRKSLGNELHHRDLFLVRPAVISPLGVIANGRLLVSRFRLVGPPHLVPSDRSLLENYRDGAARMHRHDLATGSPEGEGLNLDQARPVPLALESCA